MAQATQWGHVERGAVLSVYRLLSFLSFSLFFSKVFNQLCSLVEKISAVQNSAMGFKRQIQLPKHLEPVYCSVQYIIKEAFNYAIR